MKNIKNYLTILLIVLSLSVGSISFAEGVTGNSISQKVPIEYRTKLPTSKKALAKKFIIAMFGVAASSIIIYVMLTVYNRFIYGSPVQAQTKSEDDDFKTPNNLKDALDIFLKKTK